MPKFVVSKGHDAFAYYETVVEADTPEQARSLAQSVYYEGEWLATGYVQEFDDYEIDEYSGVRLLEDGETVEAFVSLAVTAQERDAVLAAFGSYNLPLPAETSTRRSGASSPITACMPVSISPGSMLCANASTCRRPACIPPICVSPTSLDPADFAGTPVQGYTP